MNDRVSDIRIDTTEPRTVQLRVGFALSLLFALALVGCGQEARSETEVPSLANHPELTTRALPKPNTSVEEEARWAEDAFPVDGQNRDEPRLTATDQDGTQKVEAELSEELRGEGALEAQAESMPQAEAPLREGTASEDAAPGEPVYVEPIQEEPIQGERVQEESVQDQPVLQDPATAAVQVAVGEELVFTMEAELNTDDNQPGDVFYAYLSDDLVAADGMILLPRGVRARGRVLEARASENPDEMPVLEVQLDELIGEEGDTPIEAFVVDAELEGDARDSDSESVVKVLTGAAAGAILGRILGGDDDDAVKGGVAGAAAGAAVAYGSRGGHAKLAAGAHIVVRLERPLTVF